MRDLLDTLTDPRSLPIPATAIPADAALHRLASDSLAATTGADAEALDARIAAALQAMIDGRDGEGLERLLDTAPSIDVRRHLWRALSRIAGAPQPVDDTLAVTLFAIPLVIVAAGGPTRIAATLRDVEAVAATLREHGALRGNQAFGLSNALVAAESIETRHVPALLHAARARDPIDLRPAALDVAPSEQAHLRFLVGSALAAPGPELLGDGDVSRFGLPLARKLIAQLSAPSLSLVALPRAPASLSAAVVAGRSAQREVSAQLFASSALRELRAAFGEPVAVLSAHRCAEATGGGELRLSLSSPFSPRDAHGFRCPLAPAERVTDAAAMLLDLMRDCRVGDVRVVPGVHPDRDGATGVRLLFKPETIPPQGTVH